MLYQLWQYVPATDRCSVDTALPPYDFKCRAEGLGCLSSTPCPASSTGLLLSLFHRCGNMLTWQNRTASFLTQLREGDVSLMIRKGSG